MAWCRQAPEIKLQHFADKTFKAMKKKRILIKISIQIALVQERLVAKQTSSHYLNQCWPRSLTPYIVTRPQWVNTLEIQWGMSPGGHHWSYHPGALSSLSCYCNSSKYQVPLDEIYGYPIFQWVAWMIGCQTSNPNEVHQGDITSSFTHSMRCILTPCSFGISGSRSIWSRLHFLCPCALMGVALGRSPNWAEDGWKPHMYVSALGRLFILLLSQQIQNNLVHDKLFRMNIVFLFKFNWNVFPMIQLTIEQHWFR